MEQADDGCEFVLQTGSERPLLELVEGVLQCFEDPECLVQPEDQTEGNRVVIVVVRCHGWARYEGGLTVDRSCVRSRHFGGI